MVPNSLDLEEADLQAEVLAIACPVIQQKALCASRIDQYCVSMVTTLSSLKLKKSPNLAS